jgi:SnoaL-like domain
MPDHSEIVSLVVSVAWAVDHEEREIFSACWAEDASLRHIDVGGTEVEIIGREKIAAFMNGVWMEVAAGGPKMYHIVTSPAVTVKDDQAELRYYTIHLMSGVKSRPAGVGEYQVSVRREQDGKWRITRMLQKQLIPCDIF